MDRSSRDGQASLLALMASQPRRNDRPQLRYDPGSQVSKVRNEGAWVYSWDAPCLRGTKKGDRETGEDAKGQ